MSKKKVEPVTCLKVHELLGLETPVRNESTIVCPSCGRKKLGVNFRKETFNCFHCGVNGSAINYWALWRNLDPKDTRSAAREYYQFMSGNTIVSKPRSVIAPPKIIDVDIADINTRDKTYNEFLNMLTLNPSHLADLKKRGLDEQTIERGGYKSNPSLCHGKLAQALLERGCILEGVPGFYKTKDGSWTFQSYGNGYFIPQRDGRGRIQGLQIRLDTVKKDEKKYLTVSSPDKPCGARAQASCHMARGKSLEDIIITEGPLKADIIRFYTGYTVLGIQGVNCISSLLHALFELKKMGCRKVTIAFDMDLYSNPHVKKALDTLKAELMRMRLPFTTLYWDQSQKGLDDWLHSQISSKKSVV